MFNSTDPIKRVQTFSMISLCTCLFLGMPIEADEAKTRWHYVDKFSAAEKHMLNGWISQVQLGLDRLFDTVPKNYTVELHRRSSTQSPVPWAHTSKGWRRKAHLYVDTRFNSLEFSRDWTASHELSHLLFPYLGDQGRWFAEGLASYLQYPIMYASEVLTWPEVSARVAERLQRVKRSRIDPDLSVLEHNRYLSRYGDFPRLYWGGASYFGLVDKTLAEQKQIRLFEVIAAYADCCTKQRIRSYQQMITLFDEISGSHVFTEVYQQTMLQPGTPNMHRFMDWYKNNPPDMY